AVNVRTHTFSNKLLGTNSKIIGDINLDKKYKDYTTLGIRKNTNDIVFANYKFRKQVSTKIHMHNTDLTHRFTLGIGVFRPSKSLALDCGRKKLTRFRIYE
ncbi:MAG TPA: hypothetical protein VE544_13540, partial [Nitrososphaeraceae archaeon]|nr:hypothetical protein [Nitrososphaeraceae archaeon]